MREPSLAPGPWTAAVLSAALLSACGFDRKAEYFGTTERPGKETTTFYVNNGNEPEYLDPGLASDSGSSVLLEDLFEGLVVKHPEDLHPTQGVATHWEQSDDNTVFRFHLRPEARWSDGKPVTAHDFVYAWSRILTASTGARMATMLHIFKNGKLFHEGKLQVASRSERLRKTRGGAPGDPVEAGTAFEILERSDGWARVRRHRDLPTFVPKQEEEAGADPKKKAARPADGWLPESALALDRSVLGMRAEGDHLLEVELENPTPYFIELCGYPTLYPVRQDLIERFEKLGTPDRWYRPENILTNGPYTLDEHQFRYQITFKRNPYHYDHDRLKVHRIVWMLVESYHATMNLYYAGELDYIGANLSLPDAFMDMLEGYHDFSRAPYLSTYWYEFNTKKDPVDDARVRRALDLAIDKQLLIDKVTRADQIPATHFVPDHTGSGYASMLEALAARGEHPFRGPGHDFDPARARAELEKAGYRIEKRGGGYHAADFPGIEILYNTSEGHRAIAVAIQGMWQEHLGIRVQLRNEEWKVMLKNMRDGHFQVARLGWIADYNHPNSWLDTFLSYSGNNWTGWKDPAFDRLVEEAARTADPNESIAKYVEAERRAVEAMPKLPLYFYTKSTLLKPYVKGFWNNAVNEHYVRWMWIDPDWRDNPDNAPSYPPREFPEPKRIAPR